VEKVMEYLVEGKPHATLSLPVKDQKDFAGEISNLQEIENKRRVECK